VDRYSENDRLRLLQSGPPGLHQKTVALEVGEYGIRCNCLVPGSVDTEAWRSYRQRLAAEKGVDFETYKADFLKNVPLKGQISSTEDVTKPGAVFWSAMKAGRSPGNRSTSIAAPI